MKNKKLQNLTTVLFIYPEKIPGEISKNETHIN